MEYTRKTAKDILNGLYGKFATNNISEKRAKEILNSLYGKHK